MSLFKDFSGLLPYIQSVRKIKNYFSFDVSFPKNWKLPKKYVDETKVLEQTSQIADERLLSFVSEINEDDFNSVYKNILTIIKYNLDREEKERLFETKVNELKMIFEKQNLKNLKNLQFDIKSNKVELDDNEEEIGTTGLASEPNE